MNYSNETYALIDKYNSYNLKEIEKSIESKIEDLEEFICTAAHPTPEDFNFYAHKRSELQKKIKTLKSPQGSI